MSTPSNNTSNTPHYPPNDPPTGPSSAGYGVGQEAQNEQKPRRGFGRRSGQGQQAGGLVIDGSGTPVATREPKMQGYAPKSARLPQPLNDDGGSRQVGFGRLVGVEFRKLVDTRSGKWLIGAAVVLSLIATGFLIFGDSGEHPKYVDFLASAGIPLGFLLPILGILTVTTEWSQRSGLVTFTLEPRRMRVGLSKWAAAGLMGAAAVIVMFISGAFFTLVAQLVHGNHANWHIGWGQLVGLILVQLLGVSQGIAFGMLIQNTPAAICSYLFIPVLVSLILAIPAIRSAADWVSLNQAQQPIMDGSIHGQQWAKFAVAECLWFVLPMVAGLWRLNNREVKSA